MNPSIARLGPGETLEDRRQRMATEIAQLAQDEIDTTARAIDMALELSKSLATSQYQLPGLREHSARVASALGPYLNLLNQLGSDR